VGLLDITKVFHEALGKVERSSTASEQLFTAMAGVQSELGDAVGSNPQAAAMLAWAERLKEKTALPDLTTVMDSRTQPATVSSKTTHAQRLYYTTYCRCPPLFHESGNVPNNGQCGTPENSRHIYEQRCSTACYCSWTGRREIQRCESHDTPSRYGATRDVCS